MYLSLLDLPMTICLQYIIMFSNFFVDKLFMSLPGCQMSCKSFFFTSLHFLGIKYLLKKYGCGRQKFNFSFIV